ncbi:protein CTLA-2-beta isoform X2 [Cimex lectularius]|uniref:Cathepsin propeptide inhibitor domain-containing protein n=1 Tax=Cimex lectularius TaxID=79782 RepID=A0A8I6R9Y9_CIMLE|nr:protein CTLA-2-beta isoform X2 [Cimex lectularius]
MSEETWESWKVTYSKSYATPEEEAKRKEIWETTKKRVKEHNEKYEKGEVTFKMGVNQFADLEEQEWKSRHCGLKTNKE